MSDDATYIMYDTLALIKQYAEQIEETAKVEKGTIRKCITELTRQKNNYRKRYITAAEFNMMGPTNTKVKREIADYITRGFESEDWKNFCYYVISLLNQMAFDFVRPGEVDTPCPDIYMSPFNFDKKESPEDKAWAEEHPENGAVLRWKESERVYWAERKKQQKAEREWPEKEKELMSAVEHGRRLKQDALREEMQRRFKTDPNDLDAKLWLENDKILQKHDKEMKK